MMAKCSRCGCVVDQRLELVTYPSGDARGPSRTANLCPPCLSFVQAAIEGRPVFARGLDTSPDPSSAERSVNVDGMTNETVDTLGDALPREMARVRDKIMPAYLEIGAGGAPALFLMRASLDAAAKAMVEGDVVAMIAAYQDLKAFEL